MDQHGKPQGPIPVTHRDPQFRRDVLRHKEARGLNACFSCGACTAGCPISEVFPGFSPRKLAKMVKLGMKQEVLASPLIWCCTTCHSCEQHCPQNVNFFDILNVLKNMAAEAGYAPAPWVEQTRQVMQTGLVFPTDDALAQKRKARSLPALKSDGAKAKSLIASTGADKIQAQGDR